LYAERRVDLPNSANIGHKKKIFDLFAQKVLVVVGKGGTGRTTVARVLAELGTKVGKRVAVIAGTSGTHFLAKEDPLLSFSSLEPGQVLISYLNEHGLGQLGKRLSSTGLASIISTAIPGIADLLVLAKIKQMERSDAADLIIFDAPASGHFLRLIATPKGLADIAAAGPLRKQSKEVLEMLDDPTRLGVAFVTIAEETPVKESIETMKQLKENSGIVPCALFINSVLPSIPGNDSVQDLSFLESTSPFYQAAEYMRTRSQSQKRFETMAAKAFGLKPIEVPLVPTVELSKDDIRYLADIVELQIRAKT
jgi:hypothetical protein